MNSPQRKPLRIVAVLLVLALLFWGAAQWLWPQPKRLLTAALLHVASLVEPAAGQPAPLASGQFRILEIEGGPKELGSRVVDFAFQAPDHFRFSSVIDKQPLTLGRDGDSLWIHAPAKKFGVVGKPGVARFLTAPDQPDTTKLPPVKLPVTRGQLVAAVALLEVAALPDDAVAGEMCRVLRVKAGDASAKSAKLPPGELQLWLRAQDRLPVRARYQDGKGLSVTVDLAGLNVDLAAKSQNWSLPAAAEDHIETVAVAHLAKFLPAAMAVLNQQIPTLGPAKGERHVIATEGKGRLESIDDTRVLFLKGSPAEMGRQHGVLMKQGVRNLVSLVLYGVGVGSSFDKGRWFFGEIERAQARLAPFIDARYLEEMDAMALAAGLDKEEARLSNFFPELFHCSGFAVFGSATKDQRIYHGRILDYMKGVGLEPNAVVIVHQPDYGHAWANVSYAGFIGSVTAMNAKHISIGEMGGRGEGNWDGKPMAQLVREVMEKASTLDEAVAIMRRGPRTCEYYYVIADGNAHTAVGIAATPDTFEVVRPGEAHPRLPHAIKDAVVLSAGDRYEKLSERVQEGLGKFDEESARRLMDRPVAMKSNIHSVLFAPDTLDFWVANADAKNVASHTRYTHYNLGELLKPAAAD